MNRSVYCSLLGAFLGALAPVGWMLIRFLFFSDPAAGLWQQTVGDMLHSAEHVTLYLYMGAGTALAFACFGYAIGRPLQQLEGRARSLDQLSQSIEDRKAQSEKLFRELDRNIRNFHVANTHIQKSINVDQAMHLAAERLHDILDYDRIKILALDPQKTSLEFVASIGSDDADTGETLLPSDARGGVLYQAIAEVKAMVGDMTGKIFEGMVRRKEESRKAIAHVEQIKELSQGAIFARAAGRGRMLKAF